MHSLKQFILSEPGSKIPLHPKTLRAHDKLDPAIWMSYEDAKARATETGKLFSFVFTEADPYFLLDIDHCLVDGAWSELAVQLCQTYAGAYIEVGQSGTSLHIIGKDTQSHEHGKKNVQLGIELYTQRRHVALTESGMSGSADAEFDLSPLIAQYFPPKPKGAVLTWASGPCSDWNGYEDDDELIAAMVRKRKPKALEVPAATTRQLWEADEDALGEFFPPTKDLDAFDRSSADVALLCHLAFWTGKDCARMEHLFEQSALCRDKWLDRAQYREDSILFAIDATKNVHKLRPKAATDTQLSVRDELVVREGHQLLDPHKQIEHFAGCTYVDSRSEVFVPGGMFLKAEQFKVRYGGYIFGLDSTGNKESTNAWEVFTQSRAINFPKTQHFCFRPSLPPLHVFEEEGLSMLNTYIPIDVPCTEGDPSPMLDLLGKMLPDDNDREIVLSYMAATVQFPGKKYMWCPILQGTQGNGKSKLAEAFSRAVGLRYTHDIKCKDISNSFNAWLSGKVVVIVDEIDLSENREAVETLKTLITSYRASVTPKGVDSVMGDSVANFMGTCNPQTAVPTDDDTRRYAIFYCAQQSSADLLACGMGGRYFPDLVDWLNDGGYAIFTNYLKNYEVPDRLHPDVCHRAPRTTSTEAAITNSRGGIEQEIMEAVAEGTQGFRGGWVSSIFLNTLIASTHNRAGVSRAQRPQMLLSLGYVPHPALKDGRTSSKVEPDGAKPRLYILKSSPHLGLSCPHEVAVQYTQDQTEDN